MNRIFKLIKRYIFFLCALAFSLLVLLLNREIGVKTFGSAAASFKQMLYVLPPVMILLGLMDEWISRETMIKYMGEDSGLLGIVLAIAVGSIAAGPMYAAFPFAAVMLKKGARFSNIIIFMSSWCVTKIPTLLFEMTYLGYKFTLARLMVNLPGIILMGILVQRFMPKKELERLYKNTENGS